MKDDVDTIDAEIERRISAMESKDYVFPKRFSKKNYIFTVVIGFICLLGIIAGGFIK